MIPLEKKGSLVARKISSKMVIFYPWLHLFVFNLIKVRWNCISTTTTLSAFSASCSGIKRQVDSNSGQSAHTHTLSNLKIHPFAILWSKPMGIDDSIL